MEMETLLIGINSKYIHPAMGVFQIYANSHFQTSFKEFTIKDDKENIINYINNSKFDILGFSVYIWNINFIKELLLELPLIPLIILGGPEASYRSDDFISFPNVRFIIKNEGEEAFNLLLAELNTTKDYSKVPNLYYRENNQFKYSFSKNPDISKIKYDYSLINDFKNRVVYLEASRGCPFKCTYCLASLEDGVRFLNIDLVKDNIKFALKNGARVIKFLDRSFNIKPSILFELLDFIKANDNYITTYQFEVVGDLLSNEVINYLKTIRKGLIRFEIGIQSLNEKTTTAVKRTQNLKKLINNINSIKDNIVIHLDLIAGLPYEDKSSFINTFNKTFLLFADELQLGFLKELKGTFISLTKDLHGYSFALDAPYEVIQNKYISKEDLDEIRYVEAGLNKFYNSTNFPNTINYLFKELLLDPYQTFLKIVKFITLEKLNTLQLHEIIILLIESLKDSVLDIDKLIYIIKQDYLTKFNLRPKIFWDNNISREERNKIYLLFVKKYNNLIINDLYKYAQLEKYKDEYFLISYKEPKSIYLLNKNDYNH